MLEKVAIIPAILPRDWEALERGLARVRGMAPLVQIDIVDGVFAQNITWPYSDPASFERVLAGEQGMPHWEEFDFEFDLMIRDPLPELERYVRAGASRLVLHLGSERLAEALAYLRAAREDETFAVEVGLAIVAADGAEALAAHEGQFDFVQVMGIDKVGFQGQPFDERAVALVEEVREHYPDMQIQVDGAVSVHDARALARAGATRLIVGSGIFAAPDPAAALAELREAANAA